MRQLTSLSMDELWPRLSSGSCLVAVNRRTARFFAAGYAEVMRSAGFSVWETPDILTYAAWLRRWIESLDVPGGTDRPVGAPILLEAHQEQLVWQEVIQASDLQTTSLRIPEAAEAAMQAWTILQTWQLPMDELQAEAVEDEAFFVSWAAQFEQRCREHGWLDASRLADWIAAGVRSGLLEAPQEILLAGFDEWSPQQESLFSALSEHGCAIRQLRTAQRHGQAACIGFSEATGEAEAAARWARSCLEAKAGQRVGIVVPDLEARRYEIKRVLDEVLHPESLLPEHLADPRVYNISLGEPLTAYPLVRTALFLLDLAGSRLDLDNAGELLRSPFLGSAETEAPQRAALDRRLREAGKRRVGAGDLLRLARDSRGLGPSSGLAEGLEAFRKKVEHLPKRQRPSQWLQSLVDLLEATGWPGERSLSSQEYQTLASWRDVQERFAELDRVAGRIDLDQALSHLKRLSRQAVFQSSQPDLPLQVLGMLEAAGEQFDHLWILGLHSEVWPPAPAPNPLLPAGLQRRYSTPHASAERELAFARRVTERLLASADQIVVSYPQTESDRQLKPSPLLSALEPLQPPVETLGPRPGYSRLIKSSGQLETVSDSYGPPLDGRTGLGGGTGLLKAQSDCPFRAFALYRLQAEPLPSCPLGLTPAERGILVHTTLQEVWRRLKDRDRLLAMAAEEQESLVRAAAERAVADMIRRSGKTFKPRFRSLELERLEMTVQEWLDLERRRPPFRVQGLEQKQGLELSGLSLDIFTDRIDSLPDGRVIILDYKTGRHGLKEWFGDRVIEPQLPLYALACQGSLAGMVFAQVRRGESRFLGLVSQDQDLPGAIPMHKAEPTAEMASWTELLDFWQERLTLLAREVIEGYAAVTPNPASRACDVCQHRPLCRRQDQAAEGNDGQKEGQP